MENKHQILNCNKYKCSGGSAPINSNRKIQLYPAIRQVQQNKTWALCSSDIRNFRLPRTGLKKYHVGNCDNFIVTENSILGFSETYPFEHSIFSYVTRFLYTDDYVNDRKIMENNLTKNLNNYLWLSNHALDVNFVNHPEIQYENDSDTSTSMKNSEKTLEKSQKLNRIKENEVTTHENISEKLRREHEVHRQDINTPIDDTRHDGRAGTYEEISRRLKKSKIKLSKNSDSVAKCCSSRKSKIEEDKGRDGHYENPLSVVDEYEGSSKTSCSSNETWSQISDIIPKEEKTVQVFCVNCKNEPDYAMPLHFETCFSEPYVSAEESSTGSSCECVTCPVFDDYVIESKDQGAQTVNRKIPNKIRNIPVNPKNKSRFIDRQICELKNASTRQQCSKPVKTSCAQYSTPELLIQTNQCQNDIKRCTIDDDMASFSALSMFFIMKDLNTGSSRCCDQQESLRLLSTAMICMRLKNNQQKKKPPKPKNNEKANGRTGTCLDISRPDCTRIGTITKEYTEKESQHSESSCECLPCPSNEDVTSPKTKCVFTETPKVNNCKILGIQTSEFKEKRHPKELNLLLSFHPDKKRNLHDKDCPARALTPLSYRSHLQRKRSKTDKTAQASVPQKCAYVQLSTTNNIIMREKGNQFCPNITSKSIQPSSTILLRQSRATDYSFENTEKRNRKCGSDRSTESILFCSTPPCSSYLPELREMPPPCALFIPELPERPPPCASYLPELPEMPPPCALYLPELPEMPPPCALCQPESQEMPPPCALCQSELPPPCALYLPEFHDKSGQTFENTPRTPFMVPMTIDVHESKSSTSLACIQVKKKCSIPLRQEETCTTYSKQNVTASCVGKTSEGCRKIKESNPPMDKCLDFNLTWGVKPSSPNGSSYMYRNFQIPAIPGRTKDSEDGLEILKLNQMSRLSKEHELFSSFGFKSANDFGYCGKKKKDMKLIGEDFQTLKKAIEKFMSIDGTDKKQ